jgi:type I site-specific restriction endonuclease
VHRVITTVDATGWRPGQDELDRYGREVPDDEYQTKDFERVVALHVRTRAMARHPTDLLKGADRFAKTLVFCVDQEHAAEMRQEFINLDSNPGAHSSGQSAMSLEAAPWIARTGRSRRDLPAQFGCRNSVCRHFAR